VRFVVDEVALEQAFSELFGFPLLVIIPPLLHTHLSPPHEMYDSPDQDVHYHILCLQLRAFSLTRHLAALGVRLFFCAWLCVPRVAFTELQLHLLRACVGHLRYTWLCGAGIPNLFWMATHLTKLPRFRDTPLTVRPPPPPSTRLEKKIHNYIIKTNKANLTARFCYLIIFKAEFRLMTSDFKT
jgi:hypothetical protein